MNTRATQRLPLSCLSLLAVLMMFSTPASAEPVPTATRTAFKCKVDGKIVYSDEPCLGGQKIEVEPPRAPEPPARRPPPTAESQRECRTLDTRIQALEREEKEASKAHIASVQNQLFAARKRFAALGC